MLHPNRLLFPAICLMTVTIVLAAAHAAAGEHEPRRLAEARVLPTWLELSGHQRTRYEALDGQFRSAFAGRDQLLALRTALQTRVKLDGVDFVAEVMDSRQALADDGTPLGTSMVNTLELLQGYVSLDLGDRLGEGSAGRLLVGRHTMDVGSRRLIARNRYRNTINNFTGVNGTWTASSGTAVRAFYVLPVDRLPSDRVSLRDNDVEFDREDFDVRFWGVHAALPALFSHIAGEIYLFGLHEDDGPSRPTRNRNLRTTGLRVYRNPQPEHIDFELEFVLQFGVSRASKAAADVTDLDHAAHFHHLAAGYTFDAAGSRLVLQFDHASGDADPDDGDNNRFDTLYGARRFDFGPTGIYGAFARGNLVSPGYRLVVKPRRHVEVMAAHRFYWLAAERDAWTTSGLRDAAGASGRCVGNQAEIRIRWDVRPGNLRLETGAAHLWAGEFMTSAPNANGEGDATYAYLQTVFTF